MCKAAIDRMTTGFAAELEGTGVRINALGTSGLVMTPGVAQVSPHTPDNVPVEPDDAMPAAAVVLCSGGPEVTGRLAYSMDVLERPFVEGPWALAETW
jgi:NAD(P)-dependent dehydrogenase (short-subunit alcohol dehydrogenase family)